MRTGISPPIFERLQYIGRPSGLIRFLGKLLANSPCQPSLPKAEANGLEEVVRRVTIATWESVASRVSKLTLVYVAP
jgi:hypothetical protein